MTQLKFILLFAMVVFAGCTNAVDKTQIEERDGLFYNVNDTDPFTGTFKRSYENGDYIESNYLDGIKHGLKTRWYENGQKSDESNYVDGHRQGVVTNWYENGQKSVEANFVGGEQQGLTTAWHKNEQKKAEVNFVGGIKQGLKTR
jgi:antitoxin component YwqK of YwqJK toxin-antitoxin module